MIARDSSAILAILLQEPEEEPFERLIAGTRTVVGAPTLVETRLVLESHFPGTAESALRSFLAARSLTIVAFDAMMVEAAIRAFEQFGRGRGHPAKLNFGDCLSYAVAKTLGAPLLFKGYDFIHTDLVSAYTPEP